MYRFISVTALSCPLENNGSANAEAAIERDTLLKQNLCTVRILPPYPKQKGFTEAAARPQQKSARSDSPPKASSGRRFSGTMPATENSSGRLKTR
ncbi:hypothetical protein [Neisseria musculi]|uniref:hypothetical protein n=1 Tax=Neisseria musculi TaxID=1815583 RepID=UPI00164C428E|nr:hypothetical protein [Neisseria musculi]